MSNMIAELNDALVGRYLIEKEIGQGGMATVYLARDVRHDRNVAIKVLHPELAAVLGPERFVTEMKVTASLQHPHILPLFDSGTANNQLFYVMPLIEGESLRDKLAREQQLPIDEAVRLTTQVAGALDYAHRHGVVHRDIKPENILLHDGSALVADFGIALAISNAGGTRLTQTGLSLGTPQYMSPEQATGEKHIDGRTDIYSLGCLLYEMLIGEAPFTGPTVQAIISRVMTESPRSLAAQRRSVPPQVEDAVLRAIEKLPSDRFATPAEFAAALAGQGPSRLTASAGSGRAARPAVSRRLHVVGAAAIGVLAVLALWGWSRPTGAAPVTRWNTMAKDVADMAISRDGSHMAFVVGDKAQLMVRDVNNLVAQPIPEAPSAYTPFFSPDGQKIAFVTASPGALKVVALTGGTATTLVPDSAFANGGDWSDDGWLYYLGGSAGQMALMKVSAAGGPPRLIARPDTANDELFFSEPKVLPGGKRALIVIVHRGGVRDIAVLDLSTGKRTVLTRGIYADYAVTGHLIVLTSDGTINAARFDANRGILQGPLVPLPDRTTTDDGGGFNLSRSGMLAYFVYSTRGQVVRIFRSGEVKPVDPGWTANFFSSLAISPDGKRLAVVVDTNATEGLWVRSLDNGTATLVASAGTFSYRPVWSADGKSLTFNSDRSGNAALYRVPADASAPATLVLSHPRGIDEAEYSRDGAWLVVRIGVGANRDLFGMRPGKDTGLVPLVASPAEEDAPAISPDGHWLAYNSNESGKPEIYVRPFPNTSTARYAVSNHGGTEPRWSHSGQELFYRDGDGNFVSVAIDAGSEFHTAGPRVLFPAKDYVTDGNDHSYDISADDQSFYFIRPLDTAPTQLVVVLNWLNELREKVK